MLLFSSSLEFRYDESSVLFSICISIIFVSGIEESGGNINSSRLSYMNFIELIKVKRRI